MILRVIIDWNQWKRRNAIINNPKDTNYYRTSVPGIHTVDGEFMLFTCNHRELGNVQGNLSNMGLSLSNFIHRFHHLVCKRRMLWVIVIKNLNIGMLPSSRLLRALPFGISWIWVIRDFYYLIKEKIEKCIYCMYCPLSIYWNGFVINILNFEKRCLLLISDKPIHN